MKMKLVGIIALSLFAGMNGQVDKKHPDFHRIEEQCHKLLEDFYAIARQRMADSQLLVPIYERGCFGVLVNDPEMSTKINELKFRLSTMKTESSPFEANKIRNALGVKALQESINLLNAIPWSKSNISEDELSESYGQIDAVFFILWRKGIVAYDEISCEGAREKLHDIMRADWNQKVKERAQVK